MPPTVRVRVNRALKISGGVGLAAALAIILWREGPDYGALLWVSDPRAAAFCVVATLSVKPRLAQAAHRHAGASVKAKWITFRSCVTAEPEND